MRGLDWDKGWESDDVDDYYSCPDDTLAHLTRRTRKQCHQRVLCFIPLGGFVNLKVNELCTPGSNQTTKHTNHMKNSFPLPFD